MHLLIAQPGEVSDGSEAIDLGQSPGEIIFISAADTELACLSQAIKALVAEYPKFPTLRLANMLQLQHHMSVDLYVEEIIEKAKIVIVRVLGGRNYWSYGIDEIVAACSKYSIPVGFIPGDDQPDIELANLSSIKGDPLHKIWQFQLHGGAENARHMLCFAAHLIGFENNWQEPKPLVRTGLYWPRRVAPDITFFHSNWDKSAPIVGILFYRALIQAGNTEVIDKLIYALRKLGLNPLPIFTQSLRDPVAAGILEMNFSIHPPEIIINATGFSISTPGSNREVSVFEIGRDSSAPMVMQMVFSSESEKCWRKKTNGLPVRDIAMSVALPEVDGRILTRAVSFKEASQRDEISESNIVSYRPKSDRIDFTCQLLSAWVKLRNCPKEKRRVAILLANYPNQDGRLGNGVGLDTPEAVIQVLNAMAGDGYIIESIPKTGDELIARLKQGPTNDFTKLKARIIQETFLGTAYKKLFGSLPRNMQKALLNRWGSPEKDPFYQVNSKGIGFFAIPAFRLGKVTVGLQPARGYNINPKDTYHSPDLVPPHNYFAFYWWLRFGFKVDAIINMGKHGNLEWLPGKSLALSKQCYPEAILGPTPLIYPFIVNDPGEGTQAKRRTSAVIIDHLTPPLTRAESYGPLRDLEQLVDEYFEASGLDPRRLVVLREEILSLCEATGLDKDCGFDDKKNEGDPLAKLDNYLCELKEIQIRDGLHIFGLSPEGDLLDSLLLALLRIPRNNGLGKNASLTRALANDLLLDLDPLDCNLGKIWNGNRPLLLKKILQCSWRTYGDTVERLETLALSLISGRFDMDSSWRKTAQVMDYLRAELKPMISSCGSYEIKGLLRALDGAFVEPGPAGAPTRGRVDVLPTGRNFYSVDTRTVPTPAAWTLGWKSANALLELHRQSYGIWPKTLAINVWGTSNMRTGGDDIAQALAFLGVKPTWDSASRRVTGFEVLPITVLGRPRVDVTLRISGFFRDAFPGLINLFDSAVQAVANLDETEKQNPLSAAVKQEIKGLSESETGKAEAKRRVGCRIFGSKPGAYGAGLQALIDEKGWKNDRDLAEAYISWGGFAYGGGRDGLAEHELFEKRLQKVEVLVQNQDNREHDILDSDDYYQFEGGISAAVRYLSGTQPYMYHNDHSRPESPRIRSLKQEIARTIRARAVNPKWIKGVMKHGYKGAFEIAATVDYLFAFAATARCVDDHHFDTMFEAYLVNDEVRQFLKDRNSDALVEIANRFKEAEERGLWKTRRNDTKPILELISKQYHKKV